MRWIVFATLAALFYLAHDYILKNISDRMNPVISGFILSLSAFLFLGAYLAVQMISGTRFEKIKLADFGTLSFAGLLLALATISFIKTFEFQAPFSIAIPYIYVVMIVLGVISGAVFFKESISLTQVVGIALCCIGLFLVVK